MQIRAIPSGVCCLALLASASIAFAGSSSNPDKQFLILAAKTDMTEAHEGEIAEAKAWRADVKSLAKTLVQDHTESYEHLTELAAKTGVTIPKGIDTAKDPIVKQLGRLMGASFDYQFAKDEVAANRFAIAAFRREAAHGKDAEVKAYASKMIPILLKDLHLAKECIRPAARS
jgi:putative membrane protein